MSCFDEEEEEEEYSLSLSRVMRLEREEVVATDAVSAVSCWVSVVVVLVG